MGNLALTQEVRKETYTCWMCKKQYYNKFSYRIQSNKYVSDWEPKVLYPICRICMYREHFGSKFYRKQMKEGVLDGKKKVK